MPIHALQVQRRRSAGLAVPQLDLLATAPALPRPWFGQVGTENELFYRHEALDGGPDYYVLEARASVAALELPWLEGPTIFGPPTLSAWAGTVAGDAGLEGGMACRWQRCGGGRRTRTRWRRATGGVWSSISGFRSHHTASDGPGRRGWVDGHHVSGLGVEWQPSVQPVDPPCLHLYCLINAPAWCKKV
jgi:hypothetical protein